MPTASAISVSATISPSSPLLNHQQIPVSSNSVSNRRSGNSANNANSVNAANSVNNENNVNNANNADNADNADNNISNGYEISIPVSSREEKTPPKSRCQRFTSALKTDFIPNILAINTSSAVGSMLWEATSILEAKIPQTKIGYSWGYPALTLLEATVSVLGFRATRNILNAGGYKIRQYMGWRLYDREVAAIEAKREAYSGFYPALWQPPYDAEADLDNWLIQHNPPQDYQQGLWNDTHPSQYRRAFGLIPFLLPSLLSRFVGPWQANWQEFWMTFLGACGFAEATDWTIRNHVPLVYQTALNGTQGDLYSSMKNILACGVGTLAYGVVGGVLYHGHHLLCCNDEALTESESPLPDDNEYNEYNDHYQAAQNRRRNSSSPSQSRRSSVIVHRGSDGDGEACDAAYVEPSSYSYPEANSPLRENFKTVTSALTPTPALTPAPAPKSNLDIETVAGTISTSISDENTNANANINVATEKEKTATQEADVNSNAYWLTFWQTSTVLVNSAASLTIGGPMGALCCTINNLKDYWDACRQENNTKNSTNTFSFFKSADFLKDHNKSRGSINECRPKLIS